MNTCGKTAYTSAKMARTQSRWIERKGKVLREYRCPLCFLWHLTSQQDQVSFMKIRHGKNNTQNEN